MNNQVRSVVVMDDSPVGSEWRQEWEVGAKSIPGAKRSINKLCCEWNAYFGEYDFVIVSLDGKSVNSVYSKIRRATGEE